MFTYVYWVALTQMVSVVMRSVLQNV